MFTILQKREIAPNTHEVVIEAPHVVKKARPGQYVVVMADEASERVPYTLCDWDAEAGSITLVVLEVGRSSRKLVLMKAGDRVAHVLGHLGIPVEIKRYGTVVLTAGCYGIGAILSIAKAMKGAGNHVVSIVEARSSSLHYYKEKLEGASDEVIQTTIDGSRVFRGHAMDVLAEKLRHGEALDLVFAVGCPFMMMLTGRETAPHGVRTLVALNPIMVDATGMCGACRVSVGGAIKFACVDGPFFDAQQVDWDELWARRAAYRDEETHSVEQTGSVYHG